MSIILKGIDMPKEGEWLEVIIKPTKEVIVDTIRYGDNALLKTEYGLSIQIPRGHGRLIDADKYLYFGDLEDEPTILEAEENK